MKKQSGQILIMVLVFVALGALLLAPSLALASTTLISIRNSEERMKLFYAADGGIELGKYEIKNGNTGDFNTSLNECNVSVAVTRISTNQEWLQEVTTEPKGIVKKIYSKTNGNVVMSTSTVANITTIQVTSLNDKDKIMDMGVWIPYSIDSVTNILGFTIYPTITKTGGGTSIVWEKEHIWIGDNQTKTFVFSYPLEVNNSLVWVYSNGKGGITFSSDLLQLDNLGIYLIEATAINANKKQQALEAYAVNTGQVSLLSFQYK